MCRSFLIVLQTIVKNKEGKLFTSFIYSLFGVACAADHDLYQRLSRINTYVAFHFFKAVF
ncbi:hypothetical protein EGCR1_08955 [Enterococcus gilvus]|nr:hypothetical protein EGCR1_08955 [Enterococcus gilvus]